MWCLWLLDLQGVNSGNVAVLNGNFSLATGLAMLAGMSAFFLLMTWYLDNVIPTEYGVAKPPLFFLSRGD